MPSIHLSDIAAGEGGTVFTGKDGGDRASFPAPAGDVNGDGIQDFVIGAPEHFNGGPGRAYVIFGGQDFDAGEALDRIGTGDLAGFEIVGESRWTGYVPRAAGDVNGDGFDDIILCSLYDNEGGRNAGSAYVVFGKADMDRVDLDAVDNGTGGFKMVGDTPFGYIGYGQTATGIGDINQDGLDDVLVAAPTDFFSAGRGAAYVVFGRTGTSNVDLGSVAAGQGGFLINPEAATLALGGTVSPLGDVNGDGIGDFGLTSGNINGTGGFGYVVYGHAGPWTTVELSDIAAGIGGFRVNPQPGNRFGWGITAAGDVNGDGIDDFALGSDLSDAGAFDAGAIYVVFGQAGGLPAVDLAAIAAGQGGFRIIGEGAQNYLGYVAPLGDVNADGFDDLVVSARGADGGNGAAYVVHGKADTAEVDTRDIARGQGGIKIFGHGGTDVGFVAGLGDVTGDGLIDFAVGDYAYQGERGAVFLIEGQVMTARLVGTEGDDSLAGTGFADTIHGLGGNDTAQGGDAADRVTGREGADQLLGEAGADTVIGGTGADLVDGGEGDDAVYGNDEADTVGGGLGDDTVSGGGGDDWLSGSDGADRIASNDGADTADGGAGADVIAGGTGRDLLRGGTGHDSLRGGADADTLDGGTGADWLEGGDGADRFVFRPDPTGSGPLPWERIRDFDPDEDAIDLTAFGFADAAAVLALSSWQGIGVTIALGALGGRDLHLDGVVIAALDADAFLI